MTSTVTPVNISKRGRGTEVQNQQEIELFQRLEQCLTPLTLIASTEFLKGNHTAKFPGRVDDLNNEGY